MSKGKKFLKYAFLTISSLLSIFPLYYMFCGATNKSVDVVAGKLIPGTYLIENFKTLTANQNLGLALWNSLRNSVVLTLLCVLFVPSPDTVLRFSMTRQRISYSRSCCWP